MITLPYEFQVTQDSVEPHTLADWWAETLGWEVEPSDEELIRRMVDAGQAGEEDVQRHNGRLVWRVGTAIRRPAGAAGSPRMLFQRVPEPKTVKNRMHLDVRVGADDVAKVVDKLVARGARVLHEGRQGPYTWTTMADPEGNEFCVTPS